MSLSLRHARELRFREAVSENHDERHTRAVATRSAVIGPAGDRPRWIEAFAAA